MEKGNIKKTYLFLKEKLKDKTLKMLLKGEKSLK